MSELIINTGANAKIANGASADTVFDDDLRVGRAGSTVLRTLLRFDFSALPASAEISAATLSLWLTAGVAEAPFQTVHFTTAVWTAGQTTWNSRATGVPWSAAGGDFNASAGASLQIPASSAGEYLAWDVATMIATVRAASGTTLDVLLKNVNEGASTGRSIFQRFADANPPKLTIAYTLPAGEARGRVHLGIRLGV